MSVSFEKLNNFGVVTIDNAPVNAIGRAERQGLLDAVQWAEKLHLDHVIVTGAGRAFAAGADAKEFDGPALEPHLPDVLNAIEQSFVPWVAAINGVALGGGAEIALACRMRIMAPTALIGLPEVTLGVIPGAGGTQRLPRLVGLTKALDMITTGKPLKADEALEVKLVDNINVDPIYAASMINTEELVRRVRLSELPPPEHDANVISTARVYVAKKSAGQNAPQRAIDVIKAGLTLPFQEGMTLERATFLELRTQDQAKALRHIFFAERGANAPKSLNASSVSLGQVAVVGGGTMGAGIAYALLNAGLRVVLLETDMDGVVRARANVDKIVEASLKRGMITDAKAADHRSRLTCSNNYADAGTATLAIEAAFENIAVKQEIFGNLHAALPADAILATNTSYLDVNEIAAGLDDTSRVVGLHFFAPAHIMKLLEIVRSDTTNDAALATGFALGKLLGKTSVLAGVCDGFIGNRLLTRYREAADTVLMDASTPWDIDTAMTAFGYAMGPYEAQDLSGLDIAHANRRRQDATRDPNRRYIPIADRMVDLGKLGKKTGAGWYQYPDGAGKTKDPIVANLALEEARFAKATRFEMTEDEISERLVFAMINEAADILNEGIAASAADIDLVTVFGYGFPRWRGGLMHYADTLGASHIVDRIAEFAKSDPVAWSISPALIACRDQGLRLSDYTPEQLS
jgi:3-hydroxyacyl-CoA dehydrogenase